MADRSLRVDTAPSYETRSGIAPLHPRRLLRPITTLDDEGIRYTDWTTQKRCGFNPTVDEIWNPWTQVGLGVFVSSEVRQLMPASTLPVV